MQFALHLQHGGGLVHASEIGQAWQNIQDYICHKSERVVKSQWHISNDIN